MNSLEEMEELIFVVQDRITVYTLFLMECPTGPESSFICFLPSLFFSFFSSFFNFNLPSTSHRAVVLYFFPSLPGTHRLFGAQGF